MKVLVVLNQHFISQIYEWNRKLWLHSGNLCGWKFTIDALFLAIWPNLSGRFVIQSKLIMKTFCCMQMITKCNNSFFLTERMWGKWVTLGQAYNTRPMYFNDFLRDFISAFYCSFWQQIRCPNIHSVTSLLWWLFYHVIKRDVDWMENTHHV